MILLEYEKGIVIRSGHIPIKFDKLKFLAENKTIKDIREPTKEDLLIKIL